MNRSFKFLIFSCALIGTSLFLGGARAESSSPGDQAAMKLAKELTSHGIELFIKGDGAGLAAQYVDDAEIVMTTFEAFGAPTIQVTTGKDEIAKVYQTAGSLGKMSPVNDVHFARFITPEILHIAGVFSITDQGETKRYPFTQIRKKDGDKWKIVTLELQVKK